MADKDSEKEKVCRLKVPLVQSDIQAAFDLNKLKHERIYRFKQWELMILIAFSTIFLQVLLSKNEHQLFQKETLKLEQQEQQNVKEDTVKQGQQVNQESISEQDQQYYQSNYDRKTYANIYLLIAGFNIVGFWLLESETARQLHRSRRKVAKKLIGFEKNDFCTYIADWKLRTALPEVDEDKLQDEKVEFKKFGIFKNIIEIIRQALTLTRVFWHIMFLMGLVLFISRFAAGGTTRLWIFGFILYIAVILLSIKVHIKRIRRQKSK